VRDWQLRFQSATSWRSPRTAGVNATRWAAGSDTDTPPMLLTVAKAVRGGDAGTALQHQGQCRLAIRLHALSQQRMRSCAALTYSLMMIMMGCDPEDGLVVMPRKRNE
jgi:hypothetical protein